jgi:hypothetical protein
MTSIKKWLTEKIDERANLVAHLHSEVSAFHKIRIQSMITEIEEQIEKVLLATSDDPFQ